MRKILPSNLCQRTIIKRISFDFNLFNPGDDGDERVLRGTCRDLMTSEPAEDLQLSERYYIPYCCAALEFLLRHQLFSFLFSKIWYNDDDHRDGNPQDWQLECWQLVLYEPIRANLADQ